MLIGTRFREGTNDKREQHQQKGAAAAFTHNLVQLIQNV